MNVLIEEGYGLGNATIKVVNTVKGILYILGLKALSFSNIVVHFCPSWLVWGRNQVYCVKVS